jgi:hypothetical protein
MKNKFLWFVLLLISTLLLSCESPDHNNRQLFDYNYLSSINNFLI